MRRSHHREIVERRFSSSTAAVMVGKLLLHRMYVCVRVVQRLARRPMPWRGPLAYTRERSSRDEWREAYQLQYDYRLPTELNCLHYQHPKNVDAPQYCYQHSFRVAIATNG